MSLSELGLAKFLGTNGRDRLARLGKSVEDAKASGMQMVQIADEDLLRVNMTTESVLGRAEVQAGPTLWLVVDDARPDHLVGVLSPFELM